MKGAGGTLAGVLGCIAEGIADYFFIGVRVTFGLISGHVWLGVSGNVLVYILKFPPSLTYVFCGSVMSFQGSDACAGLPGGLSGGLLQRLIEYH